jgi:hypothetical protein
MFHMTLHPYAVGFGHRVHLLEAFCQQMREFPDLWNVTGSSIAAHWQDHYPAATHLRLEPSIWKDYPGSLS